MVGKMDQAKKQKVTQEPKEMITPLLRKALTKQGTNVIVLYIHCCFLLIFSSSACEHKYFRLTLLQATSLSALTLV